MLHHKSPNSTRIGDLKSLRKIAKLPQAKLETMKNHKVNWLCLYIHPRNIADEEGFLTKVVTWIGSKLSTSNFAEMVLRFIARYNSIDSIPGLENTPYKNLSRALFFDTLSKTTIIIPTFSLTNCKPLVFSSNPASYLNWDDDYDDEVRLSDVVLGSTAAPKYLPPHSFTSKGNKRCLPDGGLAANNPTLLALCEAKRLNEDLPNYSNYLVLSLGTGKCTKKKNDGQLIGTLVNANGCTVELYMSHIFRDESIRKNYLRIQDYKFGAKLDDVKPEDFEKLKKAGNDLLGDDGEQAHVMFVDPETGEPEQLEEKTLNKTALAEFAKRLSDEMRRRRMKQLLEEKDIRKRQGSVKGEADIQ
ncbi:hypothetical protein QYF36_021817 [Acer negundo]|nr:hypothetical protein QYF36_021817 [Acer negundo]